MSGKDKSVNVSSVISRNVESWAKKVIPKKIKCRTFINLFLILLVCYVLVTSNHAESSNRFTESIKETSSDNVKEAVLKEYYVSGDKQISSSSQSTSSIASSSPKTILFWTPYYDRKDFTFGFGQEPFVKAGCKVTNCIATADRSLVNQSDAILFHALQFSKKDIPSHRLHHQRYVFYLYETIPNTSIPCIGKCLPAHEYPPDFFNWTMTHRRDSDVYVAEPYGAIAPQYWKLPSQMPADLAKGTMPPDPSQLLNRAVQLNRHHELANRTKLVAWFNSHCPTHSQREDYVKELAKFVQVDIYGKCGNLECLPRNDPRCESLLDNYKFYLAMENSLCPDYVTEKFYRALDNNVVPIVYGGADYVQYAPPHSYINIADFRSPKDLSDYLHLLDKNDALYLKYFEWKSLYKVVRRPMSGWCDLCAQLNQPEIEHKSYKNVDHWWVRQMPCYPGSSFLQDHL